jgi:hypothetical protein
MQATGSQPKPLSARMVVVFARVPAPSQKLGQIADA